MYEAVSYHWKCVDLRTADIYWLLQNYFEFMFYHPKSYRCYMWSIFWLYVVEKVSTSRKIELKIVQLL